MSYCFNSEIMNYAHHVVQHRESVNLSEACHIAAINTNAKFGLGWNQIEIENFAWYLNVISTQGSF